MSGVLLEYFDALDRLIKNTPQVVPKNTRISNDAVAIEAGRRRGSIKRSRSLFRQLIEAIDAAANNQVSHNVKRNQVDILKEKYYKIAEKHEIVRAQLEYSISNNIKMAVELLELRKELARLRGGQVIPLFSSNEK